MVLKLHLERRRLHHRPQRERRLHLPHALQVRQEQALTRFAKAVRDGFVMLKASGGYERPVTAALASAGTRQAREFARAAGQLAKTDRVDAKILALMGRALPPARCISPPSSPCDTILP